MDIMDNEMQGEIKKSAAWAIRQQEEYLYKRLRELKISRTVTMDIPQRISKIEYEDRENYYEYWLDKDQDKEVFLFSEILRFEFKGNDLGLCQYLSNEQILYIKPPNK